MIAACVAAIFILIQLNPSHSRPNRQTANTPTGNYSALTYLIGTQFTCSCNTCNDIVSSCTCPTGKATKDFIEKKVQKGLKKNEIIDLVQNVFGHFRG